MAARGLAALSTPPRLGASATPCSDRPIRVSVRPAGRGRRRRSMVVLAGGPPSTNVLILAFVLPLSLFVGTLVAAARVAADLDERFLREMEINQAIMEENLDFEEDGSDEDDDGEFDEEGEAAQPAPVEKEGVLLASAPRSRNRPKREV